MEIFGTILLYAILAIVLAFSIYLVVCSIKSFKRFIQHKKKKGGKTK